MGAPVKEEDLEKAVEAAARLEKAAEDVQKSNADIRGISEKMQAEMKLLDGASSETVKRVDDALLKHADLTKKHDDLIKKHGDVAARIVEIEQTLAQRRSSDQPQHIKSIGEQVVESEQFKGFSPTTQGSIRIPVMRKDILNVDATVGTVRSPASSIVPSTRFPIVNIPEQKLVVRDLIPQGRITTGMLEYPQETTFTNNAAVVTEASTKPQSELAFELKTAPVRTIAHYFKASRQMMEDAAVLQSYIDARARYGLRLVEEDELLNGDGSGAHIRGIIPSATTFNAAFVVSQKQRMDTIRLAILQVYMAKFPASGIVLNPIDWAAIQTTKDNEYRYIIGNPQDGNTPRLWGLPVVESFSMDASEFLVGAFNMAMIFDRMDIEVVLSTENSDDFVKNLVTIRAEERLALAIWQPTAFVTGNFDTAT